MDKWKQVIFVAHSGRGDITSVMQAQNRVWFDQKNTSICRAVPHKQDKPFKIQSNTSAVCNMKTPHITRS